MEKLLFEIGTEEIPAKFMPGILAQLQELAAKKMTELRIPFEGVNILEILCQTFPIVTP